MSKPAPRLSAPEARMVRTTVLALSLGTGYGLFVSAHDDPVAIGWPLTPFIGAFWGGVVGLLLGGSLRVAWGAVAPGRSLPVLGIAAVVLVVTTGASSTMAWAYGNSVVDRPGVRLGMYAGVVAIPAVVVLVTYLRRGRSGAEERSSAALRGTSA